MELRASQKTAELSAALGRSSGKLCIRSIFRAKPDYNQCPRLALALAREEPIKSGAKRCR